MSRILIIDDSRSVHAFVKECLSQKYFLESTFNGQEGVRALTRTNPVPFDLVLLDWEMPVQDGPTTLKELRSLALNVPVVMMTSKNAVEDITSMLELGAKDYVMKPFTKDILLEKVMQVLEGQF